MNDTEKVLIRGSLLKRVQDPGAIGSELETELIGLTRIDLNDPERLLGLLSRCVSLRFKGSTQQRHFACHLLPIDSCRLHHAVELLYFAALHGST